jgi:hypothetical protein
VTPSSETETRSRGRSALDRGGASRERGRPAPERGGVPLEGTSIPRVRRNLTRGGDQPTSEAELYRCGAVPLERSGVPPEGGWADCLTARGSVGLFCACVWVHLRLVFTSLNVFPLVV